MDIYTVKQILETNYGYDNRRDEQMSLLILEDIHTGDERSVEVSEEILTRQGITAGRQICFTASGNILKYIRVVAAIICENRNGKNYIFSTARGYGTYKGWWEFPGGKIEKGETSQQALHREIREELTAEIAVGDLIMTIEYDYPEFHLSMDCFWAKVISGTLELKEAEAARWLTKEELDSVKWLPADEKLVELIRASM